jgi:hypothetical protein
MKVTVNQAILHAVRVLAPALARSSDAIYGCQIAARDGHLSLRALSETWDASYTLPATVHEPGTAWIPGPLVRSLPWSALGDTITLHTTASMATISGNGTTYTAALVAHPSLSGLRPGTRLIAQLPGPLLSALLRLGSASCAARGDERAVHLASATTELTAYSFDGAWLSRASTQAPASPTQLALSALSVSSAAAGEPEVALLTSPERTVLTLRAGPLALTTRLLAAPTPLPPAASGTPTSSTVDARLSPLPLLQALKHALAIAGTDPLAALRIDASGSTLSIALEPAPDHGLMAGYRGAIAAEVHRPFTITVSGRSLLRSLAPLASLDTPLELARGRGLALRAAPTALPLTFTALIPECRGTLALEAVR